MAKDKSIYVCNECGGTSTRWLGKCPSCGAWNSLVETVAEAPASSKNRLSSTPKGLAPASELAVLSEIEAADVARTPTGLGELDRVNCHGSPAPGQSRSSSLIEVFERVCSSTRFTITAQ